MFKAASIFNISFSGSITASLLQEGAEKSVFVPCGLTQEKSIGWVPPRGHANGALVESVGGQLIMQLMIETRTVPPKAIEEAVDLKCAEVEKQSGRKVGKRERGDYKEDARLALLPHAFPSKRSVLVWIDMANGKLIVDSATASRTDEVVTRVVQLVDGLLVALITTNVSPATLMTNWLLDGDNLGSDDRFGFDIDKSCELKATDESKAKVRYTNHNLMCDEVVTHIRQGKGATKLGLTYDGRVSFTLNDTGTLTGIKFLEVVFETSKDTQADAFDANTAILTGEMTKLIPDLIDAMGGEFEAEV